MLTRPDISNNARSFSAVILRQHMSLKNEMWSKLNPSTQLTCKQTLLQLLIQQPHPFLRKKIDDIVGCLAAKVMAEQPWPELLPAVFQLFQAEEADRKATSFRVLDKLAEFCFPVLAKDLSVLKDMLQAGLSHQSSDVRLAALTALVTVVLALDVQQIVHAQQPFAALLPLVTHGAQAALQAGIMADSHLADSLEQLGNVAQQYPKFLRPVLPDLIEILAATAQNHEMESAKMMALELMLLLGENAGAMMRKVRGYVEQAAPICLNYLIQVDEVPLLSTYFLPTLYSFHLNMSNFILHSSRINPCLCRMTYSASLSP